MAVVVPEDFDYDAEISFLEIRDQLPLIDPECLSPSEVLAILLHLFQQKRYCMLEDSLMLLPHAN